MVARIVVCVVAMWLGAPSVALAAHARPTEHVALAPDDGGASDPTPPPSDPGEEDEGSEESLKERLLGVTLELAFARGDEAMIRHHGAEHALGPCAGPARAHERPPRRAA